MLAVIEWRPLALEAVRLEARATVLVLDAVQDPGNVGTMIRTAYALGAAATIALDGTADLRSPKVLRAAMGAAFRHQLAQVVGDVVGQPALSVPLDLEVPRLRASAPIVELRPEGHAQENGHERGAIPIERIEHKAS